MTEANQKYMYPSETISTKMSTEILPLSIFCILISKNTLIQFLIPSLFLLFPILVLIKTRRAKSSKFHPPLPPGPVPRPIIGNMLQMSRNNPHVQLAKMAQTHGPLFSLKLGTQLFVIGSSPEAAMEILKTQDRVLTGREVLHVSYARDPRWNQFSILWAFECNKDWSFLRKLCKTELFSSRMIENQSRSREKRVEELVNVLRSKEGVPTRVVDFVEICSFNFLAETFFSHEKFASFDELENGGRASCAFVREGVELCAVPNVSDFYPFLARFDIQGVKKIADGLKKQMCSLWAKIILQRRSETESDKDAAPRDFLDVLLHNGFTDDQIDSMFMELFVAGTHSTMSAIEWTMAETIKNPQVLQKMCAELDREISDPFVKESDLTRLPYVRAAVKESLRLHPLAPLLLPHRALETCQVMNYTVPKDTQVLVNVWAISRDPKIWENPSSFIPERFLDPELDNFKSNDFKFLPFSAGRRICPGLPMAAKQVELMVANLFHCFEWSSEDGGMLPRQVNTSEKFNVVLEMEHHLVVIPKYKH